MEATTLTLPALPAEAALRLEAVDSLRRQVDEMRAALAEAETAAEAAKGEPGRIAGDIEEARRQRAEALARDLDRGSIDRSIRSLKEQQEIAEDKAAGMESRLAALTGELFDAEVELRNLEERIEFDKLALAVARYNALAEELAPLMAEILVRRQRLQQTDYKGGVDGNSRGQVWERSVFESLPRLYLHRQERPQYNHDANWFFTVRGAGHRIVRGRAFRKWWNPDCETVEEGFEPVAPAAPVYPEEPAGAIVNKSNV